MERQDGGRVGARRKAGGSTGGREAAGGCRKAQISWSMWHSSHRYTSHLSPLLSLNEPM